MTAINYGERMLARAERRARGKAARRRFLKLFLPAVLASCWATADLVAARGARLAADGAGSMRLTADAVLLAAWLTVLVVVPLGMSVKRDPVPAGAGLALVAGPVATAYVFGPGGWHAWQVVIVSAAAVLILLGTRARSADRD